MKILKNIFLPIVGLLCVVLPYLKENFFYPSWIGYSLLFLYIYSSKNTIFSFLKSWITGIIFFIIVLEWLRNVTYLGYFLLCLYCGFYWALFGIIFYKLKKNLNLAKIFFLSSIWTILELLRSILFTGFEWALVGHSQASFLEIIQIASWGGCFLISLLVILINLSLVSFFKEKKTIPLSICIIIICIVFLYGKNCLNSNYEKRESLKICIVQPNISQEEKNCWEYRDIVFRKTFSVLNNVKKLKDSLIIFPESCIPASVVLKDNFYLKVLYSWVKSHKTPLLIGALIQDKNSYYNTALLLKPTNHIQVYKKIKLVPFGEYIPLKKFFPFLKKIVPLGEDISKGKDYKIFDYLSVKFATLICFEDTFSWLSSNFIRKGAQFLVNITNDAWFGRSSQPWQHLQSSIFRAVENRVYVVRSANTGISCIISPKGEIIEKVEKNNQDIFVKGCICKEIFVSEQKSFFTTYPYLFPLIIVLYSVIYTLIYIRESTTKSI